MAERSVPQADQVPYTRITVLLEGADGTKTRIEVPQAAFVLLEHAPREGLDWDLLPPTPLPQALVRSMRPPRMALMFTPAYPEGQSTYMTVIKEEPRG
jgi:hypothetical protein